jgi:hypothetical protein
VLFVGSVLAAESPREIDPNTRIQGGADVRESGAKAGAGMRAEDQTEKPKPVLAEPEKSETDKDKPISERKPQERDRTSEQGLQRFIRP